MDLVADHYLLRWRFDYHTGSKSVGMWSQPGEIERVGAWRQSRAGVRVVRAFVEGKHVINRITSVFAECDGADFVNFEWLAHAHLNPFAVRGAGGVPRTTLEGLSLVTREEIITVVNSGTVTRTLRPESHKSIGFATYGK